MPILAKEMFPIGSVPFELGNFSQNNWRFDINIIGISIFLICFHKMAIFVNMCIVNRLLAFIYLFIIEGIIDICCGYKIQAHFNW